jgi:membrane fusion protein (multidrug efflux system)
MFDLKNRKRTLIIIAAIVIAGAVYLYMKHRADIEAALKNKSMPVPEVSVAAVEKKDVPLVKEWVGTTQGDVNAEIHAKISGYLLKRNYEEGSVVKAGDLLFEIDPRPYQAALDQAKGDLEQAQSAQKKSQADVRRYSALVKEGAVSQKEYTDAIHSNGMTKAAIASAKAALDQAQLNLNWTKVNAPISGLAGASIAQVGDLIDPSMKLTTISVTDPIRIIFPISENEYIWHQRMNIAAADGSNANTTGGVQQTPETADPDVTIILNDGSTYPEKGAFTFTDRQVDPNTGTINVRVTVPNSKGFLRPGQYAKVRAQVGVFKDALVIPRRAIIETQGTKQVAVVSADNKVEIRDIKVGYIFDNNRIVTDGLKEGERIIVEGFLKVKNGMTVNPK